MLFRSSNVTVDSQHIYVTALGAPPDADPALLRQALNDNGMADADLTVRLVLGGSANCPPGGDTCIPTPAGDVTP